MEPTEQQAPQTNMTPKQQITEQIKAATSIVVSAGKNPSLDDITTVIGLTHMLQAMGKHATGVISTTLPKAVEFLNPNVVIEPDTKRLQDFVVSLHKDKADKLRYKVDGDFVKIFITPYKTVISEKDFSFTSGDYNIDTVVAVGVMQRNDIDDALLESPRILGDSKVVTINKGEAVSSFGVVNWNEPQAVSVSEMVISISESLGSGLIKPESSQALLTGLVSATEQFGNQLTTPKIMTMAAQLMAAGADQQVIVKNLKQAEDLKIVEQAAEQEEIKPREQKHSDAKKDEPEPEEKKKANPKQEEPEPAHKVDHSQEKIEEPKLEKAEKKESSKTKTSADNEPHVNTHPELPTLKSVLENKVLQTPPAKQPEPQAQPEQSSEDLERARQAVKQAEDAVAPANPEPEQSLNAQNVESGQSSDITIDHNGDVVLPQ